MKKVKGFTLIELLVVIAIIALLLGIIMPALGKAKTYAQEIVCKSNLHQYQIATEIYSNDHDDDMPDPWASLYSRAQFANEPGNDRYCRWHRPEFNLQANETKRDSNGDVYAGPYWPYLAATKVNVCPLFSRIAERYGSAHMEGNGGSTAADCAEPTIFAANFSYSMNVIFSAATPVKKTQVANPSQTFIWAEENMWYLNQLNGASFFISDHVLNDNALAIEYDGNRYDSFGSYHKISNAKLAIQQDSHNYESNTGVANALMADGSLAWVTPEDNLRYMGRIK